MSQTTVQQTADTRTLNLYADLLGLTQDQVSPDRWATSTRFDADLPCVEHGRDLEPVDGFSAHVTRLAVEGDAGTPEVAIRWRDNGAAQEEFYITTDKIPQLIRALTVAYRTVCPPRRRWVPRIFRAEFWIGEDPNPAYSRLDRLNGLPFGRA